MATGPLDAPLVTGYAPIIVERTRRPLDLSDLGFPVTLCPPVRWPEPIALVGRAELASGGFLVWSGVGEHGTTWDARLLPEEVVIRELLELDTADDDALLSFVTEFGAITKRHREVAVDRPATIEADRLPNHIADVRSYLLDAQRCARTWIAWKDDEPIAPAWYREDARRSLATKQALEAAERDTWADFAVALNEGVSAFPPRVQFEERTPMDWLGEQYAGAEHVHRWGQYRVGLYSALCLQLWNLILENPQLHECQSETCRRRFVRQRGGAKHGQYRTTGVMYCTPACAQAQKQREYRRRQKEKR
jgi:hypothetical protein